MKSSRPLLFLAKVKRYSEFKQRNTLCLCAGELGSGLRPQQSTSLHNIRASHQTERSDQDRRHPTALQLQRGPECLSGPRRSPSSASQPSPRPAERPAQDRRDGNLCLPLCTGWIISFQRSFTLTSQKLSFFILCNFLLTP